MSHHLDDETLALYIEGRLTGEALARVHEALAQSPALADEVLQLARVLDLEGELEFPITDAAATRLAARAAALWPEAERVRSDSVLSLAIRWLGEQLAPLAEALQPVPMEALAVRGAPSSSASAPSSASEELRYHVTLGQIPLEIDLASEGPGRASVFVRPLAPPPAGLMVRLSTDGQTRAMSLLSAGGAALDGLVPGDYELVLEQSDQAVGRLPMRLFAEGGSKA